MGGGGTRGLGLRGYMGNLLFVVFVRWNVDVFLQDCWFGEIFFFLGKGEPWTRVRGEQKRGWIG